MKWRPRHLLRFRLRTMLIVVTLLCLYLGWQSYIVRQRRMAMAEVSKNSAFQLTLADAYVKSYPPGSNIDAPATVPLVRSWIGDQAVQTIWYTPHLGEFSKGELARLSRLFPEAEEKEWHLVPCHPGCFPKGSLVETLLGPRPIESIRVGDRVVSVDSSGQVTSARVASIFTTNNSIWEVITSEGPLATTDIQPLCLSTFQVKQAGDLQPGEVLLRLGAGGVYTVEVERVSRTTRVEPVVNLVLEGGQLFVVNGFVARGKPLQE
jgi:hypothetical protein